MAKKYKVTFPSKDVVEMVISALLDKHAHVEMQLHEANSALDAPNALAAADRLHLISVALNRCIDQTVDI